jgi:hypothetical protein
LLLCGSGYTKYKEYNTHPNKRAHTLNFLLLSVECPAQLEKGDHHPLQEERTQELISASLPTDSK